jgi:hypothetical protein
VSGPWSVTTHAIFFPAPRPPNRGNSPAF